MYTALTIKTVAALAVVAGVLARTVFKRAWAWIDLNVLPARHLKKSGVRRRVESNTKVSISDEK